jgi:hypothetical protein
MRKRFALVCAVLVSASAVVSVAWAAFVPDADSGAADIEVTVGSDDRYFSRNKQNEPAVAIDPTHTSVLAAGANDNIDLELCNAGDDTTCPFTDGVGVSGVQFSFDAGVTWMQPTYSGWTARHCEGVNDPPGTTTFTDSCVPAVGSIGTLPWYYENGLVSDGDPAVAFGPRRANGEFSWANGVRLYYANLTANFSAQRDEQTFKGFEAIAVSRLDAPASGLTPAIANTKSSWLPPVVVSRQNAALFADKEQVWADNASSSPFFGHVYICNVAFRSAGRGGAPEPVTFHTSTDGGDTWRQRQLSQAANTGVGAGLSGGRQGCTVRTDSDGVVYVFWNGSMKFQDVIYMARSFDGGNNFEKAEPVANVEECGEFDPVSGRFTFDGVAGARTNSFPSVDIANGAPTGADASDEILLTWCDGPTPAAPAGGANEQAMVQWSMNKGIGWTGPVNAAPASDRPDFPAIAISPDGTAAYLTYIHFLQPWQPSIVAPARLMQGVVRTAAVNPVTGAVGAWIDAHRGATGDARGSSANGLTTEFLGDYNYAAAARTFGVAVWNDVREAAACAAVDTYRQNVVTGTTPNPAPEPNNQCVQTTDSAFGNSDIWATTIP